MARQNFYDKKFSLGSSSNSILVKTGARRLQPSCTNSTHTATSSTSHENFESSLGCTSLVLLDLLKGVPHDTDEHTQHDENKQRNEHVQIDLAEHVDERTDVLNVPHHLECSPDVIPVDQREETFRGSEDAGELRVVWPKHNPTTDGEAEVNERHTAGETKN